MRFETEVSTLVREFCTSAVGSLCDSKPMAPREHLTWLEDNVRWYSQLELAALDREVPSCPGWDVEYIVNHLSFGLALAYPIAMSAPPDTAPDRVFADVDFPTVYPRGRQALDTFVSNMSACLASFRGTDPDTPCWTYAGPGTASFWFRRAAIETTLHRMDVAEALGGSIAHLADDQAADAISESLEFALPLAAALTKTPSGELVVEASCLKAPQAIGAGRRRAHLRGEPHDVLNALWGRRLDQVELTGNRKVSAKWLGLIEDAFGGR